VTAYRLQKSHTTNPPIEHYLCIKLRIPMIYDLDRGFIDSSNDSGGTIPTLVLTKISNI